MATSTSANFSLPNARVTRVHARDRVAYVTLFCHAGKYPQYFDVTVFSVSGLTLPKQGDSVTVTGDLSRRKPQEGSRGWTTELVARAIAPGDAALTPATPPGRPGGAIEAHDREKPVAPDTDDIPF